MSLLTIGVGVDYSVHIMHRFTEEVDTSASTYKAVKTSVTGTSGAAAGSMITTATGMSVLVLTITDMLGFFGILMSLSVFYAFITTILVLPPALYIWAEYNL